MASFVYSNEMTLVQSFLLKAILQVLNLLIFQMTIHMQDLQDKMILL